MKQKESYKEASIPKTCMGVVSGVKRDLEIDLLRSKRDLLTCAYLRREWTLSRVSLHLNAKVAMSGERVQVSR
jgi:hypothetical protein